MPYTIKTAKGYLASHGDDVWFQDEAKLHALYTSEEIARDVAEPNHSMIGTRPEEGYVIEVIPSPTTYGQTVLQTRFNGTTSIVAAEGHATPEIAKSRALHLALRHGWTPPKWWQWWRRKDTTEAHLANPHE